MSEIIKPYSLTLWEDYETTENEKTVLKERRIATIGSDTMTSPIRARNIQLSINTNGETVLTFDIPFKYYDQFKNELLDNPLNSILINERKIKLNYNGEWYHLILKSSTENSSTHLTSWTARSALINELSKNGFNIELDTELENNMGTISELAKSALDGTDWTIDDNTEVLVEKQIEPLYKGQLNKTITVHDILDGTEKTLETGQYIYFFYSQIIAQETYLQLIVENEVTSNMIENNTIYIDSNYYIDNVTYTTPQGYSVSIPNFVNGLNMDDGRRGQRIVRKAVTQYDPLTDAYVDVCVDKNGKEFYKITEFEYLDSTIVQNYAADTLDSVNVDGWNFFGNVDMGVQYEKDAKGDYYSYTVLDYSKITDDTVSKFNAFNLGIQSNASVINTLTKGEKYVMRYRTKENTGNLRGQLAFYNVEDLNINEVAIDLTGTPTKSGDYYYVIGTVNKSYSYGELIDYKVKPGLFVRPSTAKGIANILEFQFFRYIQDEDGNMVIPGEISSPSIITTYKYYSPEDNAAATSSEDIKWAYKGQDESPDYTPLYNSDVAEGSGRAPYEKVRSITISESNRYNIIMTLAETFECWAKFTVQTDESGAIIPGTKKVSFHEFIGKENFAGFKYGINSNAIQRTLNSDTIVSKIIVKDNSNEFAKDGFCSIARAKENYIKENFALNFDYFINKGLIDGNALTRDLYTLYDATGNNGYFFNLRKINIGVEKDIELQTQLMLSKNRVEANVKYLSTNLEQTQNEINQLKASIRYSCGVSYEEIQENPDYELWLENSEVISIIQQVETLEKNYANMQALFTSRDQELNEINQNLEDTETRLKEAREKKEELNQKFYDKYGYYIQEGTWISEDYDDDELYYLDAINTLYTSAFPQVTYNINVRDVSVLEKYKNYSFNCGDKTFIEDTEFFGYVLKNGVRTPYREEVVVTQVIYGIDNPSQNQITIQNYKHQFEELFQRMAATTQSLQYSSGGYDRAANTVNVDGTIDGNTFQNTIANNNFMISNAANQSVFIDDNGLTIIDLLNPQGILRASNGILGISNDGGTTFTSAITAQGINTNLLTAGRVDADKIRIMNGAYPSFAWDKFGITAYAWNQDELGNLTSFDSTRFTRFDRYGVYGVTNWSKGAQETYNPTSIDDPDDPNSIYNNAIYALTWDGFFLKSDHGNPNDKGYIRISSTDDFEVVSYNNVTEKYQTLIKIGLLDAASLTYGMQLWDKDGKPTLMTRNDGNLWLENSLLVGHWDNSQNMGETKVQLGYLEDTNPEDSNDHEVFNASDNFIVYESGVFKATEANITGVINATGGTIGGINIDSIGSIQGVRIESEDGLSFVVDRAAKTVTPETLHLTAVVTGYTEAEIQNKTCTWYGGTDLSSLAQIPSVSSNKLACNINYNDLTLDGNVYYVKVVFDSSGTDPKTYSTAINIIEISDNELPYTVEITSSNGTAFKNSIVNTTLTCTVYQGMNIITEGLSYQWYRDGALIDEATSSTLQVNSITDNIDVYDCVITLGEEGGN